MWNASQMKATATPTVLPCKCVSPNANSQSSFKYCSWFKYFWTVDLDLNFELLQGIAQVPSEDPVDTELEKLFCSTTLAAKQDHASHPSTFTRIVILN